MTRCQLCQCYLVRRRASAAEKPASALITSESQAWTVSVSLHPGPQPWHGSRWRPESVQRLRWCAQHHLPRQEPLGTNKIDIPGTIMHLKMNTWPAVSNIVTVRTSCSVTKTALPRLNKELHISAHFLQAIVGMSWICGCRSRPSSLLGQHHVVIGCFRVHRAVDIMMVKQRRHLQCARRIFAQILRPDCIDGRTYRA